MTWFTRSDRARQCISLIFLLMTYAATTEAGNEESIFITGIRIGGGDPDGSGPEPCIGTGCPEYTSSPSGPPDGDGPPWLTVTINGNGGPGPHPCIEGPCNAPPPQVRVELLDCAGNVVKSETRTLDGPSCESGGGENPPLTPFSETFVFGVCGLAPAEVRVVPINSFADPGFHQPETCEIMRQEGDSTSSSVPPPPLDGTLTKAELDCLSCEPKPQASHTNVILQKSTIRDGRVRLYTLPDERREATFGETVNGEFRVPSSGQLVIELSGSSSVIDVWSGGRFNGTIRGGAKVIESRTIWWSQPAPETKYEFSVRTFRGSEPNFKASFHWYRWDSNTCCIRHEVETLDIEAIPLTCELTGRDPAIPELRPAAPNSDGHVELRLPCCPHCSGTEACAPGDTSGWFVVFEPGGGKPIIDGHAYGWRLTGNTLWNPGADRLGYEFMNP